MRVVASSATSRRLVVILLAVLAGCATVNESGTSSNAPTSIQKLEYYPFQVKGYQNSYPRRTVLVLMPTIQADASGVPADQAAPLNGDPAIGQVIGENSQLMQRLYSDPIAPIIQAAIARSAQEAGMTAITSNDTRYQAGVRMPQDYVIGCKIVRCWVRKSRAGGGQYGPIWQTVADFGLDVTIYKPPFSVAFWHGNSNETYYDPPVGSLSLGPEDEAGIYDEPGEVLSVALTRAVAGIFEKPDLRNLVLEDDVRH
jgi:hypothetical protein